MEFLVRYHGHGLIPAKYKVNCDTGVAVALYITIGGETEMKTRKNLPSFNSEKKNHNIRKQNIKNHNSKKIKFVKQISQTSNYVVYF